MAGLIITLSVIFIIVGGFLAGRFVVHINRLEKRVNNIVHELSKTEQPLLGEIDNHSTDLIGSVSDIRLNSNRTKIPVKIKGETYFITMTLQLKNSSEKLAIQTKHTESQTFIHLFTYHHSQRITQKLIS